MNNMYFKIEKIYGPFHQFLSVARENGFITLSSYDPEIEDLIYGYGRGPFKS